GGGWVMRVLVTGASGGLGRYVLAQRPADVTVLGWSSKPAEPAGDLPLTPVDLASARALEAAYRMSRPDVVLHLAACSLISDCHRDPDRARAVNTDATARLASLARADGATIIYTSTDLVFDGAAPPYREDSRPGPLSVYGRTKLDGEASVLDAGGTV